MAEYIKRSDAMTICERYSEHCFETSDLRGQDIADRILADIAEMRTADVVEVVRRRDCKYRGTYECVFHLQGRPNTHEKLLRKFDNDFCSYGERIEKY